MHLVEKQSNKFHLFLGSFSVFEIEVISLLNSECAVFTPDLVKSSNFV